MLLADMCLKQHFSGESDPLFCAIGHPLQIAFAAPELCLAMILITVSLQGRLGLKSMTTPLLGALECR
jgi:hypothetical protein